MKIKLIKADVYSIYLFIKDAPPETKYIEVYQRDENGEFNNLLKTINFDPYEGCYLIDKHFNELNVTFFPYKVRLLNEEKESLFEKKIPIVNAPIPEWQLGIFKVKQHEFYTIAKNINGSKVLLFKTLDTQIHCPDCWDDDLKSSNNSQCPTCAGTGFINKYASPLFVWGNFYYSQPSQYSKGDIQGKNIFDPISKGLSSMVFFGDVPIDEDDLIYHFQDGTFYKIASLGDAYFNFKTFTYRVNMLLLSSSSIEYRSVKPYLEQKLKEINGFK